MKVRFDHPRYGWSSEVDLPAIPRVGEKVTLNGIERAVKHVIWHVNEASVAPWVQIILQPNSDEDR